MSTALASQPHVASLNIVIYQTVRPHLHELLSQGALSGACAHFLFTVLWSFSVNNYYKILVVGALPEFLAFGAGIGLVNGFAFWCFGRFFYARVPILLRLTIASLVVGLAYGVLTYISPPSSKEFTDEDFLRVGAWALILILSLGLITGSRLRPLRALSNGLRRANDHQRFAASLTGVLLGIALLFGFFESTLTFICLLEMNEDLADLLTVLFGVGYFITGIVIILVNPKFWLTVILAVVINAPLVFILVKFFVEPNLFLFFIVGYLFLWCGFLLTHIPSLNPLLTSISKELRSYYLID